jgi:hypothetical protein
LLMMLDVTGVFFFCLIFNIKILKPLLFFLGKRKHYRFFWPL